ncbi:MAG: hypothetical protein ABF913_04855 [Oenococcus sp.]|uniref:hypothetical protein n=1 Tax=Oenococcus sp. TaxID=1979414 RepID=UPI0039EB96E4
MQKAYQEATRKVLKPHVGQRMNFHGFVSSNEISSRGQRLLILSVQSENDRSILLNHVWLTIPKSKMVSLKEDQQVSFSALVVLYRRAKRFTEDGFYASQDYGLENVHHLVPLPNKGDKVKVIRKKFTKQIKFYKSIAQAARSHQVSVYKFKKMYQWERINK